MRTRSQTKKLKLDNENPKIPELSEDILGIILKHVVAKEQDHIYGTYLMMDEYWVTKYWTKTGQTFDLTNASKRPSFEEIEWPDYLDSNSRRLIHYTKVKLCPKCTLVVPDLFLLKKHFKTKRDLDILWRTAKNFGSIRFWNDTDVPEETSSIFLQKFWQKIQAPSQLVRALEERST